MPKGPNGEKRPADSIGCAVMVGKIATGEKSDDGYAQPGRRKSGLAGAKARVKQTTKTERSQIARKASAARWKGERSMTKPTQSSQDKVRLPYPANSLGEPKKDFDNTFRLSTAVKATMEKNK